jgi:Domain of unknown function (DUF4177)
MSTQWTYKVVDVTPSGFKSLNAEMLQEALNVHGQQGWELVEVTRFVVNHATLYFKKSK